MLCGVTLGKGDEEMKLGVILSSDLKASKQRRKVVNTANRVLGMIKRTFTCRSSDILLPLYKCGKTPFRVLCSGMANV